MANIPIPQQGQPIDYQYIYQIVDNLNELSTKVTSKFSESKFQNKQGISETHRLNDLSVVAGYKEVVTNYDATANSEPSFSYDFGVTFKYPPVVTISPILIENTNSGRDVSCIVNNVTTTSMTGYISFNASKSGKASVGVNIIAIGVPVV
jgi:hypothetical protein